MDPDKDGPEAVLGLEGFDEYKRQRKLLWPSLVTLHNNVGILGQMLEYPAKFTTGANRVLHHLEVTLFEYGLVIAWRLWHDADPRSATLPKLRNHVSQTAKPEYAPGLREHLREFRPPTELAGALKRLKQVRNRRIAHNDPEYHFDQTDPVTVAELMDIAEFLERCYNATGMGTYSSFGFASFESERRGEGQVGHLLDALALQSHYCVEYDQDPADWERYARPSLSLEELRELNRVRRDNGLSEIPESD